MLQRVKRSSLATETHTSFLTSELRYLACSKPIKSISKEGTMFQLRMMKKLSELMKVLHKCSRRSHKLVMVGALSAHIL